MRYIGSKIASLPAITEAVQRAGRVGALSLCDPFAGTCTVARHFKFLGWRVITGDLLAQSYVQQNAHISLNQPPRYHRLAEHLGLGLAGPDPAHIRVVQYLNDLTPRADFLTREYSLAGRCQRRFFTRGNAMRADAIRMKIVEWRKRRLLDDNEMNYLLCILLEGIDRVANTAGTYYAYLKRFNRKSRKKLRLFPLSIVNNGQPNEAHLADAHELVASVEADVLYLDPPYNERNYGRYYHLPETVVRWDNPSVAGRSGIPITKPPDSPFYHKSTAADALRELIARSRSHCIVLHYAANGLVAHRQVMQILASRGEVAVTSWRVRKYSCTKAEGHYAVCGQRLYMCVIR